MVSAYYEIKVRKSVSKIESKVTDISNILHDIDMKLCHLIKGKKDVDDIYRNMIEGKNY